MKILYSWLKDFIDLYDLPTKIGEKIFIHSLNVEGIDENKKVGDAIFDIELTPDRGDCLSHLGIARELAAIYEKKIKDPIKSSFIETFDASINVEVKDKKLCPRYCARVISGVKIKQSPQWLKFRLMSVGATPINNIVDITNYIMHSYGQPMHAFDFEKIDGKEIIVRHAFKDEKMVDLDNQTHRLSPNDLIISDRKKPIAIAGIFGSLDSGISKDTTNIVLESAFFNAINVRQTSKRLGLSTEASYRFERGTDINATIDILDFATELILQEAGGKVNKKIDIFKKQTIKKIRIDYLKIDKLLGTKIPKRTVDKILMNLGFKIISGLAIVPNWRTDISILEDLVEEIGRIYGYNRLPKTPLSPKIIDNTNTSWFQKELIKDILINCGFTEVYNYSFISEQDLSNFQIRKEAINKLINPLSPECAYMRPNLFIGLVKIIAKNPAEDPIEIFEIGEVFQGKREHTQLAIAISGHNTRKINNILNILAKSLKTSATQLKKISKIANINTKILANYKIRKPNVVVLSMFLDDLLKISQLPMTAVKNTNEHHLYKEISKYPSVQRDLAIIVDSDIKPSVIISELVKDKLVKTVECFDEYVSSKFGANKKSLAFRINYASAERTLNKDEVNNTQEKILLKINNKFGAKLRS